MRIDQRDLTSETEQAGRPRTSLVMLKASRNAKSLDHGRLHITARFGALAACFGTLLAMLMIMFRTLVSTGLAYLRTDGTQLATKLRIAS